MTHQVWKMLLTALVVVTSSCAHAGGSKAPPRDIKLYDYQSTDSWCSDEWCDGLTGFIRSQDEEVIGPFDPKADEMIGLTADDFTRLLEACPQ